jgi:hypothetical protein
VFVAVAVGEPPPVGGTPYTTRCGAAPLLVHVTVVPTVTVRACGSKPLSVIETGSKGLGVGGAAGGSYMVAAAEEARGFVASSTRSIHRTRPNRRGRRVRDPLCRTG